MKKIISYLGIVIPTSIVTWYTLFEMLNFDLAEFLRQSIGGGVGTYRAAIVLISVLLFILLTYIGKRAVSGEISKFKIRVFYVISLIGFLAFSILGSEFSAPKFTFAPFISTKSNYTYGDVISQSGVEFKINSCTRSGTKTTCEIGLYNLDKDIYFSHGSDSYIVDSENSRSKVTEYISGNQSYGNLYLGSIAVPIDTKSSIKTSFEMSQSNASKTIRVLKLKLHFDGRDRTITFRNIPIKELT